MTKENIDDPLLIEAALEFQRVADSDPRMSLTLADMKKLVPEPKEKMPLPLCRSKA